jgi:hypothetical protein
MSILWTIKDIMESSPINTCEIQGNKREFECRLMEASSQSQEFESQKELIHFDNAALRQKYVNFI